MDHVMHDSGKPLDHLTLPDKAVAALNQALFRPAFNIYVE
jgi:hypothetical protein